MPTLLKAILGTAVLTTGLLIAAACMPAPPTPSAVPTKPAPTAAAKATEAPATKPAATASSAAKPAATPASKQSSSSDWKAEWDKVVAAAKKEGKVVVAGREGDAPRQAMAGFEKAYPQIRLDWTGVAGSQFAPRIIGERQNGLYLWDVHIGGAMSMVQWLMPAGVLDPFKPVLILPEVREDSNWLDGLDNWWQDADRQYIFGFEGGLVSSIFVNRDFVPESELRNHDQLLEPSWKGRIGSGDLRTAGAPGAAGAWILKTKGEAWFRKFLDQVTLMTDERKVMEAAVRGTLPAMVMEPPAVFAPFQKEGLTKNIQPLDPGGDSVAQWLTSGSSHVALVNKAPNPNAAKVFVNWLLSKEAQQAYTTSTGGPSARLDVTGGDPLNRPKPGVKYLVYDTIEMQKFTERSYAIAREVLAGN